jgi:hypothetical protein
MSMLDSTRLSVGNGNELQVNHHEVRIRNRTMDVVPMDAGVSPFDGSLSKARFHASKFGTEC